MGHHAFEATERPQFRVTISKRFLQQLLDAVMVVVAREFIYKLDRLKEHCLAHLKQHKKCLVNCTVRQP